MNRQLAIFFSYLCIIGSDAFSTFGNVRINQRALSFNKPNKSSTTKTTQLFSSDNNNTNEAQESKEEMKGEEATVKKEEEEQKTPTPISDALQQQSASFTTEPQQQQRLDPLVASLTRMDEDMMNTPTTNVPLIGEIPLDGSIVVLLPVALIAVVGFIMSINIAFNSKDAIVDKMNEVNAVLSTPPVKQNTDNEGCRGLCSDQEEQLDSMRNFMNSLAPKKAQEVVVPDIVVPDVVVPEVVLPEAKEEIVPMEIPAQPEIKEEVQGISTDSADSVSL